MPSILPQTNTTEPLGLPRGSVRAIITVLLILISASLLFVPSVVGTDDVRSMFLLLTGIAVRDYFATRKDQNEEDGPALPAPAVNED